MRVLFFVDRPGVLRQFASLVIELADRGHDVHLALRSEPDEDQRPQVERLVGASPHVTSGPAPARDQGDGWRAVAWAVRALGDLARYAHPRYAHAPTLRARVTDKVVRRLNRADELGPVGRRLAARAARRLVAGDSALAERAIRSTTRLERAIPSSRAVDEYIRGQAPDVVLATSVVKLASPQVEFLKSARRFGIPAATCVASWDNLTNKGLLKWAPEQVFVWNEVQRREAIELHGIAPERVTATGAGLFDTWFDRRPSTDREEFVRRMGLDPERPYVLFVGSSPFVTNHSDDEARFVERWIRALRASRDERVRRVGVAVRPHPVGKGWRHADLAGRFESAVIWPRHSERPVSAEEHDTFYDSLAHSAAVVGINTTAMIEAAVIGKSVLTILAPEFGQESTLHFHYLREENGGFLHVASSLDQHADQLGRVLEDRAEDAERRRSFVESFVRPRGLDRPATPIFADAVEELAQATVETWRPSLLTPLLGIEARLATRRLARSGRRAERKRLASLQSRPEP